MPAGFNGSGVYLRAFDWTNDKAANIKIQAVRMDEEMDGMAAALSKCITTLGQSTVEADIPMSNHKFTGLLAGSLPSDSVRFDQVSTPGGSNVFTGQNKFVNATDEAFVNVVNFEGDRPTPLDGDTAAITFGMSDDAGTQRAAAQISWTATDVSADSFDASLTFAVSVPDEGVVNQLVLDDNSLYPFVGRSLNLGQAAKGFQHLYLQSDLAPADPDKIKSEINWSNGNVRIVNESSGLLRVTGGVQPLEVYYNSASSGGPQLHLYHEFPTPVDFVTGGQLVFTAKNSTGAKLGFASIQCYLQHVTAGGEDGALLFYTASDGSPANRMNIGAGVYSPGTSAGAGGLIDKGTDTLNFKQLYQNGLPVGNAALRNVTASGGDVPTVTFANSWTAGQLFSVGGPSVIPVRCAVNNASSVPIYTEHLEVPGAVGGTNWHTQHAQYVLFPTNAYTVVGAARGVIGTGASEFWTGSDLRMKEDVRDLDDAGTVIDALKPRRFKWKGTGIEDAGFVADEVHEVLPDAADGEVAEGRVRMMAPTKLIPFLVAEVKALRARVAALEAA